MVNTIVGTPGNDRLVGTPLDDRIFGLGGNDLLLGLAGRDELFGGDGADNAYGGDGNDKLFGQNGTDFLFGGNNNDRVDGGADNDTLFGDAGNDILLGGSGDDDLYGGADRDNLLGGFGNDNMDGGAGDDRLTDILGNNSFRGGDGNDTIRAGDGEDVLLGTSGRVGSGKNEIDILTGGGNRDRFILAGRTSVYYDDGNALSSGRQDYARIKDFDVDEDVIQLKGDASQYVLINPLVIGSTYTEIYYRGEPSSTGPQLPILEAELSLGSTSSSTINPSITPWPTIRVNELIGVVENVSANALDLNNASQFVYV